MTIRERDALIRALEDVDASIREASILGDEAGALRDLERRRDELMHMIQNEHEPKPRARRVEGDEGGAGAGGGEGKKRSANMKKMSVDGLREEIANIERVLPTLSGKERTSLRARLTNLRKELDSKTSPAGRGDGDEALNRKRPRSPEVYEIDDDSDESDDSGVVVLPRSGGGAGAAGGPPSPVAAGAAAAAAAAHRGGGEGAGEGEGEAELAPIVVDLEQGPNEPALQYYARLLRAQDASEANLNRMNEEMDRLRAWVSRAEHDYHTELDRAQREAASAQGFTNERAAQDLEYSLVRGDRFNTYNRGKIAVSNKIDRLKLAYQQQHHELDVLNSRANNVRVRGDVRRALMQEFPGLTITDQTEAFRRKYVDRTTRLGRVRCNLQTFMKKYKKMHPGASRSVMEKKYKYACRL